MENKNPGEKQGLFQRIASSKLAKKLAFVAGMAGLFGGAAAVKEHKDNTAANKEWRSYAGTADTISATPAKATYYMGIRYTEQEKHDLRIKLDELKKKYPEDLNDKRFEIIKKYIDNGVKKSVAVEKGIFKLRQLDMDKLAEALESAKNDRIKENAMKEKLAATMDKDANLNNKVMNEITYEGAMRRSSILRKALDDVTGMGDLTRQSIWVNKFIEDPSMKFIKDPVLRDAAKAFFSAWHNGRSMTEELVRIHKEKAKQADNAKKLSAEAKTYNPGKDPDAFVTGEYKKINVLTAHTKDGRGE